MHSRTFDPYLAAIDRIIISLLQLLCLTGGAAFGLGLAERGNRPDAGSSLQTAVGGATQVEAATATAAAAACKTHPVLCAAGAWTVVGVPEVAA
jgi:hypothetical protein